MVSFIRAITFGRADGSRKGGEPSKSEFTVVRVDAYNGINTYLSGLSASPVKTIEDVLAFDESNTGTEGAKPGHLPAFASGQVGAPQAEMENLFKDAG